VRYFNEWDAGRSQWFQVMNEIKNGGGIFSAAAWVREFYFKPAR